MAKYIFQSVLIFNTRITIILRGGKQFNKMKSSPPISMLAAFEMKNPNKVMTRRGVILVLFWKKRNFKVCKMHWQTVCNYKKIYWSYTYPQWLMQNQIKYCYRFQQTSSKCVPRLLGKTILPYIYVSRQWHKSKATNAVADFIRKFIYAAAQLISIHIINLK